MTYKVSRFIAEVEKILEEKGETPEALWTIGPRLQKLVLEGEDVTKLGEERQGSTGLSGREIYVDRKGRFKLVTAQFPAGEPTPVHSHHKWGVECGISGRERFTVWAQTHGDGVPEKAELEVLSDHHVERGDLGYWYNAPRNIHRQWAEGNQPSHVLLLMGGDGARQHLYDLKSGTYKNA